MKIGIITLAAAAIFASSSAFAFHCPADMKKIDDAMAKASEQSGEPVPEAEAAEAEAESDLAEEAEAVPA